MGNVIQFPTPPHGRTFAPFATIADAQSIEQINAELAEISRRLHADEIDCQQAHDLIFGAVGDGAPITRS